MLKNGMYGKSALKTVAKLWIVRRMECSIMVRLFMVTLELYFCSYELVRNILMIPNMDTPVLANVKVNHKAYVIVYQEL